MPALYTNPRAYGDPEPKSQRHGLSSVTPVAAKSAALRVTNTNPPYDHTLPSDHQGQQSPRPH